MPSTLSPQRGFSEALLEARSLKVPETHSYWVSGGHGTSSAPLSLPPHWVFSPSRLRPPTKAQDSGNGESRERPSKSCYSPHPRPLLKLELEAATMITAVTQKSFIYSITHKWGQADLRETAVWHPRQRGLVLAFPDVAPLVFRGQRIFCRGGGSAVSLAPVR